MQRHPSQVGLIKDPTQGGQESFPERRQQGSHHFWLHRPTLCIFSLPLLLYVSFAHCCIPGRAQSSAQYIKIYQPNILPCQEKRTRSVPLSLETSGWFRSMADQCSQSTEVAVAGRANVHQYPFGSFSRPVTSWLCFPGPLVLHVVIWLNPDPWDGKEVMEATLGSCL